MFKTTKRELYTAPAVDTLEVLSESVVCAASGDFTIEGFDEENPHQTFDF